MSRVVFVWAALCMAHTIDAQAPFALDTSFRSTIVKKNVNSILVMEDGKVIVSGRIYFPGDPPWDEKAGARLHPDGSRDMSFNTYAQMGGKLSRWTDRIYVQNGNGVRRLWLDGVRDTTFITISQGPYFNLGQGGDYHVYPDGRILMTGFHGLEDTIRGYTGLHSLIWFSNTGYLDTTQHHRKSNNAIYKITEQPDGKFLCSGLCSVYEGQPVGRVFRVDADGDLDTTFQTDFDLGEASTFNTLANGRILVSGYLGHAGGNDTLHMMRLLPNGALDPSFNNILQVLGDVNGHLPLMHTPLADGRIVLHGNFSSIDGQPRSGIAMIDSIGQLINDAFATPACGVYDDGFFEFHTTSGMVPDQSGNWYIYGSYIGYDDGTTNDPQQRFVSRLYGLNVGVREVEEPVQLEVYPNPSDGRVHVQLPEGTARATIQVLDARGRLVQALEAMSATRTLDLSGHAPGVYAVRVGTEEGRYGYATVVLEP